MASTHNSHCHCSAEHHELHCSCSDPTQPTQKMPSSVESHIECECSTCSEEEEPADCCLNTCCCDDICSDECWSDECCENESCSEDCCCSEQCTDLESVNASCELLEHPSFTYKVLGLDCPNCAKSAQIAIQELECVQDAQLVYATQALSVLKTPEADEQHCKKHVVETLRSTGHDVELTASELKSLDVSRSWWDINRQKILLSLSGIFLALGLMAEHLMHQELYAHILFSISAIAGLVFVAPMAFAALRRKTADMNVLMSIAVIGALLMGISGDTSVFQDAAIVIFLDQIGEWLEGWSMRKTSNSIAELMELAPDIAHLVDTEVVDVSVDAINIDQIIRILPGERIPLDGVVVTGVTTVNEAPVTGESRSQDKEVGSQVYAGTLNQEAVIDVRVKSTSADSTLARIVAQVQGAQAKAAPYQSFVDRFAAIYTPAVVIAALVIGLGVPAFVQFVQGVSVWQTWIYRSLSLLVVACPCALVISTPVSFVSAITCAARHGVLVKGGASLDAASKIDALVVDKTGTLTTGNLEVCDIVSFDVSENQLLGLASGLESHSTHPLARSVVAQAQGIACFEFADVQETSGCGVIGYLEGDCYFIGKLTSEIVLLEKQRTVFDKLEASGKTVLIIARNNTLLGFIALADTLRSSARDSIAALHAKGVSPVVMMTGDSEVVAANVARMVGIDTYQSRCMPKDKLSCIERLKDQGYKVAMVGDGINDAPALARADLACTMGANASDTALEIADVALLNGNLSNLAGLVGLARHTMMVVRQNIALAISVKLLVFVLVMCGYAGMGAAVFADTGVALLVILNGMRLMADRHLNRS